MYTTEVTPFSLIYEIHLSANGWGYDLDRFVYDCGYVFTTHHSLVPIRRRAALVENCNSVALSVN